jgi:hypothetical protein
MKPLSRAFLQRQPWSPSLETSTGALLQGNGRLWCAQRFALFLASTLLISPTIVFAQHGGGGHGGPIGGGGGTSVGRPDGVDEKDELKTFHEAMEVEATSDQSAAFRAIVKNTEAATTNLARLKKETDGSQLAQKRAGLKQSLENVRIQTRNFLESMSLKQKTGLKETTAKLAKAAADLGEQEKTLEGAGSGQATQSDSLDKALKNFRDQQGTLAAEMGIVLTEGEEFAFRVLPFKTSVDIGGQNIGVSSSTAILRTGAENGQNIYKVRLTTDLSDLQPNLIAALSPQVDHAERCGERVSLQDATLSASAPSTVVLARFYAERWVCTRIAGTESPSEVAQGRGNVEVKITPTVGADGTVEMETELGRIDADRFLAEMLRSGMLGSILREKVAATLRTTIQVADLKTTLPPAGASSAKAESARFEGTLDGGLNFVVDSEMRISDEQAKALSEQLKDRSRLSSQAVAPRPSQATPAPELERPPQ